MRNLPILGGELAPLLDSISQDKENAANIIEAVCGRIISRLHADGLSDATGDFLLPHAESVQNHIKDDKLRALHLMAE